jgi:hypothetical protein
MERLIANCQVADWTAEAPTARQFIGNTDSRLAIGDWQLC